MSTETKYYETVDVANGGLPQKDGDYIVTTVYGEQKTISFNEGHSNTRWNAIVKSYLRPVNLSDIIREAAGKDFDAGERYGQDQAFVLDPEKGQIYPDKETFLNNPLKTIIMAKKKYTAEDLEGWIMSECSIECSKCKTGNTLMLIDADEAQEEFFKYGWRQVEEECLCPKCFKKLKR